MPGRVVLAMSGGVDSSAAAVLLTRAGYEVIGLFMRTGVEAHPADARKENKKGCCSAVDAADARRVADKLDIPFHALDFAPEFGRVMDYFADEYLRGRTPNPCVVCNTWLKFGKLWEFARPLGADFVATGHYARIERGPAGAELHAGLDPDKDQSYVLHGVKRDILDRLLFPVGGLPKAEVRRIAREANLGVADKPDSVEICFVPGGDHTAFVHARRPAAARAGVFVDEAGEVLGEHDGIDRYTVGQRKGLGLGGGGAKRFVLEVLPTENKVVVGPEEGLLATGLVATEVNWLADMAAGPVRCTAKIRYRHAPAAATVTPTPGGGAAVTFDAPQPAVTPGQAVAFYAGTRVLGGGWIESPFRGGRPA